MWHLHNTIEHINGGEVKGCEHVYKGCQYGACIGVGTTSMNPTLIRSTTTTTACIETVLVLFHRSDFSQETRRSTCSSLRHGIIPQTVLTLHVHAVTILLIFTLLSKVIIVQFYNAPNDTHTHPRTHARTHTHTHAYK